MYYEEDSEPMRISLPTKGVYAESVIGKCNSCEEKDESRFWRWEESPIPDSPNTQINPMSMESRRAEPGDLRPNEFPTPMVNIQNAPAVPDPAGLQSVLQLIGKGDAFRDLTGLTENQKNALATFQKSLDTAQAFGKEAASLAKTAGMLDLIKSARNEGAISKEQAREKADKVLDTGIQTQENPSDAQFEHGMRLIDKLEKEGILKPEDATEARQKIKTAFLDQSDIQADDESSFMKTLSPSDDVTYAKKKPDGSELTITKSKPGSDLLDYIKNNATPAWFGAVMSGNPAGNSTPYSLTFIGPQAMEWKGVVPAPGTFASKLGEEYNERLDASVFTGPTEIVSGAGVLIMGASEAAINAAKQRTRAIVAHMATSVSTASGREDVAMAIELVTVSVIREAAELLKAHITPTSESVTSPQFSVPIYVNYAAKRIGMILAWLELACADAVTVESERVKYLQDTVSMLASSVTTSAPDEVSLVVSSLISLVVSDMEQDFQNFQKAIRVLQRSYKRFGSKGLEEAMKKLYPGIVNVMGIRPQVENFSANILEGWADELDFLA